MKLRALLSFGFLHVFLVFGQTPDNCGNYTTTGTSSSPYPPGSNVACNSQVPGTVNGNGSWDGGGCAGTLVTTVVGPPVSCLTVAYTAVNTNDYATLSTNTGGVLTITGVNVGVAGNVIGPYQCVGDITGYGDVMVTICSTIPFTQLTLLNTGCSSGWVINCATPVTMPCTITNLTANIGACVVGPNTYSTTGQVDFTDAPTTGQLIVSDCNGNQQTFNAPFTSPLNYTLNGQTADGLPCDVTAQFTDDPACTQTINYTAPQCLCNIDNFNANIGLCDQLTDTYTISGDVSYSTPPGAGTLIVEVDNGTSVYTTTISPPFVSPDNWSIPGIPSDGAASTVTVYFSANPGCSSTIAYNAPTSCACNADLGTFNATITGTSTNNYVLCFGDQIDINSNNDWTGPGEMFNPPGPVYDPGVSWLMYSCPPTVGVLPDPFNTVPSDPCFLGLISDFNLSDINDLGWINAFPAGTFTDNTIYWVPITMYSITDGTYSYVNGTMPCYELGAPFAVQYLPDYTFSITEDCATQSATITVNGGLPAIDGSLFSASNLLPVTASFANTTCGDGGTITVTGLNGGDMYSFTVTDGNGCPYTIAGGPFIPLPVISAGPDQAICPGDPVTLAGSGAGVGGTYTWDNAVTDGVAFNPASTTTYTVTGTDNLGCSNTDQVTVTINVLPVVGAGPDQAICAGDPVTLTGSGASTYTWDNGVTNGLAFNPAGTLTYTVTGTDANNCVNTDQVVVTVNPLPAVGAGPDQEVCAGTAVTLSGSGAGVGASYAWDNGVTNNLSFTPVATATYTVTGTDANNCSNTDQVTVTVNPLPNVSAGPDQTICIGAPVTLNGSGATTYSWNNGVTDGVPFNPVATQTYTVTGTDANLCVNTDQVVVTVNPLPIINAGTDQSVCEGAAVTLSGSGAGLGGSYTWDNAVINGTAFNPAATATYTVTGTDANGCVNTDQLTVTVNPVPTVSFIADPLTGCEPLTVTFVNTSNPIGNNCTWNFGNGVTGIGCDSITSVYNAGTYSVTLDVTTSAGCFGTATYTNYISVDLMPDAAFSFSPQIIDIENTEVEFTNSSQDATSYNWDFGDETSGNFIHPTHVYPQVPAEYLVTLWAYNGICVDSVQQLIVVNDVIIFYVPNIFTPDHDEFNEGFLPVFTAGFDPFDYHLVIFNRWGEIVFESYNAEKGWDGTYSDQGLVQDGVYIWQIEFKESMSDKRHTHRGHVTVLK
jgi:gliding motility-associated-like protein